MKYLRLPVQGFLHFLALVEGFRIDSRIPPCSPRQALLHHILNLLCFGWCRFGWLPESGNIHENIKQHARDGGSSMKL